MNNSMNIGGGKTYYPCLDLLKFISCIGIVMIHTKPFKGTCFEEGFINICPTFVSIFFICSSLLFWRKIQWNNNDNKVLINFCKRLMLLYALWNVVLIPLWLPKLVHTSTIPWGNAIICKLFLCGGTNGSWFILSLVYGMIFCYVTNRFVGKPITTIILSLVFVYYSLVHWRACPDFLNLFWQNEYMPEPYLSPIRSVFWIQCALILPDRLRFLSMLSQRTFLSTSFLLCLAWIGLCSYDILGEYTFILNALIAISLCMMCMRQSDDKKYVLLPLLRNCSIIIYFVHFVFMRALASITGFGWHMFIIAFLGSFAIAYCIILMSKRIKILNYFY